MTALKVSVVVGVLNGARTLERCIDSVANQTLRDVELVIHDGGSTDGTLDILERRRGDIAHWTSERDRGLYDAWNRALAHCRGDYVCFLGADDALAEPDALERLLGHVDAARPPDLVCSRNAVVDGEGKVLKVMGKPWHWESMKRAMVVAHPGLLHRRALFDRFGRFSTSFRIAGDYELLLRLGPDASTTFVDQVTVRMAAGGMSRTRWRTTYREVWQVQSRHPHIGIATASRYLGANIARFALRRMLSKS